MRARGDANLLRACKMFSAKGAVSILAWGIAPGIAIVGRTSAESAFQSAVLRLKWASVLNRAFSAYSI